MWTPGGAVKRRASRLPSAFGHDGFISWASCPFSQANDQIGRPLYCNFLLMRIGWRIQYIRGSATGFFALVGLITTGSQDRMFKFLLSRNFLYFIAFGGTAALVNLICGYFLYNAELFPYIVSVFIAASAGLLVNFFLNYKLNFKYKGRKLSQQFGTFLVVATIGTVLTAIVAHFSMQLLLFFEIEDVALAGFAVSSQFVAHVFSVGVITVYSFIAHKYFSFNVGIRSQVRRTIANIKSGT